jgi:hypothetical protein
MYGNVLASLHAEPCWRFSSKLQFLTVGAISLHAQLSVRLRLLLGAVYIISSSESKSFGNSSLQSVILNLPVIVLFTSIT